MPPLDLQDRFRGALLGVACGDALGGPAEFSTKFRVQALGGGWPLREMTGGGWLHLSPGEITDDTEMTVALCAALLDGEDEYSSEHAHKRYMDWYRSGPKDIGNTTRDALRAAMTGGGHEASRQAAANVYEAGLPAAGNGALMRCVPLGLVYHHQEAVLDEKAALDAGLTHGDPMAADSSQVYLWILGQLLDGRPADEVLRDARAFIGGGDLHQLVEKALAATPEQAAEWTREAVGFVPATLAVALASLQQPNFEEGVVWAVHQMGDTDTDGAVAGGLLGALHGAHGIPRRWLNTLDRNLVKTLVSHADRWSSRA